MNLSQISLARRHFLKLGVTSTVGWLGTTIGLLGTAKLALAAEPSAALSPEAALQTLMEGNQRFMEQRPQHPNQSKLRLKDVAQAQHPFATVLSCADSRVAAELIFDQGIGNIFDVRVAGNVSTPEVLGSIEYAVALLNTPLLMVLGHERCGAVTAAVQQEALPGQMDSFVKAILPAVERVKGQSGNPVENVVVANVHYQLEQLQQSSLLTERLQSGQLKIVGCRYDLDTGKVTMLT